MIPICEMKPAADAVGPRRSNTRFKFFSVSGLSLLGTCSLYPDEVEYSFATQHIASSFANLYKLTFSFRHLLVRISSQRIRGTNRVQHPRNANLTLSKGIAKTMCPPFGVKLLKEEAIFQCSVRGFYCAYDLVNTFRVNVLSGRKSVQGQGAALSASACEMPPRLYILLFRDQLHPRRKKTQQQVNVCIAMIPFRRV